jgi:acyl-CoA hydrolase
MVCGVETRRADVESVFLVRSEHLNHHGHLFGGDLMAEVDSLAYCVLRRDYPGNTFVTRAAQIEFLAPAQMGDVIVFSACVGRVGTTSVAVEVTGTCGGTALCRAAMTYVNLGADGRKTPLPRRP